MLELPELEHIFKLIGISRYEAAVYITLVRCGPLTAKEISDVSGVPYSKVYSVLNSLIRKGLVVQENSRPRKYLARHPREVYARIVNMLEDVRDRIERYVNVLESLYARAYSDVASRSFINMYYTRSAVIKSCIEAIMTGYSSAFLYIAAPFPIFLEHDLISSVGEVSKRTTTKVLTVKEFYDSLRRALPPRVELRAKDRLFGGGVITEKRIVLVVSQGGEYLAMESSHEYIIDIGKVYFEYVFSS